MQMKGGISLFLLLPKVLGFLCIYVRTHILKCVYMCVHMHVLTLCCALEPSQALELFATLGEATGVQGDGNLNVVLDLRDHYSHG